MNKDLLLAILSMDSYNRGYGQGVTNLPSGKLGNVNVKFDSLVLGGTPSNRTDAAAGFYAIAYDASSYGLGTVIAYRGTDAFLFSPAGTGADGPNGFGVAFGSPFGPQATLALKFFRAVTDPMSAPSNVTITGHSLGGGLAGFVGSIFGKTSVLFDPMPYKDAANDNHAERIAA